MSAELMSGELRATADQLVKVGTEFLSKTREERLDVETKEMPQASFLFMAGLIGLGEGSAYDVFRVLRDRQDEFGDNSRLKLPMQSAYRSASWLEDRGFIEKVREENSSTNGIPRTIYRVTASGMRALMGEGVRQVQLALSWLASPGSE